MSAITIATITTGQLAQRLNDDVGVHVWNVLTDDYFKGELIPGSRRVPVDRLGEAVRRSTLAKDASIVVYCQGVHCPSSRQARRRKPSAERSLDDRIPALEPARERGVVPHGSPSS